MSCIVPATAFTQVSALVTGFTNSRTTGRFPGLNTRPTVEGPWNAALYVTVGTGLDPHTGGDTSAPTAARRENVRASDNEGPYR